jgi:CDP-glucose 4,6-dehydratase
MGYILLATRMYEDGTGYSEPWNFGPDEAGVITVEELLKLIIKHWGNGTYKITPSNHPHETSILKLDSSKAQKMLGWRQIYNIHETAERTINWYKSFYAGTKKDELYELTISEILEYTNHTAYHTRTKKVC